MEKIKVIVNTDDFMVYDESMKRSDIRKHFTKLLKENVSVNELEFDKVNYYSIINEGIFKLYVYRNNKGIVLIVLP